MRGEDELLFEPETFLELFNVREEVDDVGGDGVNGARGFKPFVLIALDPPPSRAVCLVFSAMRVLSCTTSFLR